MKEKTVKKYRVKVDEIPVKVTIKKTKKDFVPLYMVEFPRLEKATIAVLDNIRERMIEVMNVKPLEATDPEEIEKLKKVFIKKAREMIGKELPKLSNRNQKILAGILMHESLGLGEVEVLLHDGSLEEIVINGSSEPMWVYHRSMGWLKTNLTPKSETEIYNFASQIGRRVGTQITNLNPLMDAYLASGDRANATLFPISSVGNTLTIRKFARKPWTITDFIKNGTISVDMAAFLWLSLQYELNTLITGGTASGKTALLNVLTTFIPPNQRILSIEDTREIQLPQYLHWVPLTTRPPNPEGKGEVSMLQLMVNALRMRPDRMIVGEIRRAREAEVLFEAIHTGHSVYSTLHANTDIETYRRLTNPPIDIPQTLLSSLQMIVVMHRDRRREIRRVLSVSELLGGGGGKSGMQLELKKLFEWTPSKDTFMSVGKSSRAMNDIKFFSGMSDKKIQEDLKQKKRILKWLVDKDIDDINRVGRIISEYYQDPESVLKKIKGGK